jgi:hypothetical protein
MHLNIKQEDKIHWCIYLSLKQARIEFALLGKIVLRYLHENGH